MLGWKLFTRAVSLLIENLAEALRVSALPYLVVIAVSVWVAGRYPGMEELARIDADAMAADVALPQAGAIGAYVLLALVNVVVSLWIAVAWHRYVLLDERPTGFLPQMRIGAILGYLWLSILIGLLVLVTIMVATIPLGVLAVTIPFLAGLIPVVALFAAMLVFYRLSLVLPARAVEREMSFGEALRATGGHNDTVVVLALLTVAFSLLLQVPTMLDDQAPGMISAVYQGVVGWIGLMVGVSTLTALYGHLVEGRPVE